MPIVKLCLLSYNSSTESNQTNMSYFDVPLRWRLQNRGHLKLIHNDFYEKIGINLYDHIVREVTKNLIYYDQKNMQDLAKKITLNKEISKSFHDYIQSKSSVDISISIEEKHEKKVLQDITHRVTTRYLRSVLKRNKDQTIHVGQHRTRIKSLYTQTSTQK